VLPPPVLPTASEAVASPDPWADLFDPDLVSRGLRALALLELDDADRERLGQWLSSGQADAEVAACRVVEALGDGAPPDALIRLFSSPDPAVRLAAVRAIGAVGDKSSLIPLVKLVGDRDADVRSATKNAMSAISGPPSPRRP
jgi:HEAT repeat protein